MAMATARWYDASKNPDGGALPGGVPLADLSDEEYNALPKWLQASVDASPLYRKTPLPKEKKEGE
jgi:hypothetical protein